VVDTQENESITFVDNSCFKALILSMTNLSFTTLVEEMVSGRESKSENILIGILLMDST